MLRTCAGRAPRHGSQAPIRLLLARRAAQALVLCCLAAAHLALPARAHERTAQLGAAPAEGFAAASATVSAAKFASDAAAAVVKVGARFVDAGGGSADFRHVDAHTPEQREAWLRAESDAAARLGLPVVRRLGDKAAGDKSAPPLRWPLRASNGLLGTGQHMIANFVDHDAAFPNRLRDYFCGARTYDLASGYNHSGVDISLWPDPWGMMDRGQAEIVAAAAGTIVQRIDGNDDRQCADTRSEGAQPNMITLQHADGSRARYLHMKKGSLTPKQVGETVAAGEFLGRVGSSGFSSGPHLHFEVVDAAGKLLDPYAGACNTLNAQSLWQFQPEYVDGAINRLTVGGAAPGLGSCPNPAPMNVKARFSGGETLYFTGYFRDQLANTPATYTVYRPNGTVWRQWTGSSSQFYASSYWYWAYGLEAGAMAGTWRFEASYAGRSSSTSFQVGAPAYDTPPATMWWIPAEGGWGLNVARQGDQLFVAWYTYAADGKPMWLVALGAQRQADGSFLGDLQRVSGTPFDQIRGSNQVAANVVGSARLTFLSATSLRFDTTAFGISQSKTLQPFNIGAPLPTCTVGTHARTAANNLTDIWYVPAEAGWGMTLVQQGAALFAAWFTYDASGRDQWVVSLDAVRQPDGSFAGSLQRANPGVPFHQINGAAATSGLVNVGSIRVTPVNGETATLSVTLDGKAQTKQMQRYVFNPPELPVCNG